MTMSSPPAIIGNAKVCYATIIDQRHRATGACRHSIAGHLMGAAAGLAICQYDGDAGFYLFYCDQAWNALTDTYHDTLDDAFAQAEFEYAGVDVTWQANAGVP